MKKRLILLMVLALVVVVAPAALADHCVRCFNNQCAIAFTGGGLSCTITSTGACKVSGTCSGPHPFIDEEPFAAEFTVALVERLDEPQTAAPETAVASLETTRPAHR